MRKKSLKIAIFHLAFIYSGGGEKLVLEEARGLEKLGHKVSIFAPVVDKDNCFPDVIKDFDIKTFLPQIPFMVRGHESGLILLTCVLAPFFSFRFRKFDVILAANQPSPWIAWWVKNFFGVPYVSYLAQPTRFIYPRKIDKKTGLVFSKKAAESISAKLMHKAHRLIYWADKTSIAGSDRVLANGEYIREVLEKTYKVKVVSCPAGAHPVRNVGSYESRLKGSLKIAGKIVKKPYLLITNRHFAQKRFEYGIFALSFLLHKYPDFCLVITGTETDYTNEIRLLIDRLNLNGRVIFLGYIKEGQLKKLYKNAAVYLYTAPEEDFGMGIVEAQAFGAPVVAWDNAGPSQIIVNEKTGILAKPFVTSEFSEKVLRLVKEPELAKKISSRALKRVKENFSYEIHTKILEREIMNVSK